MKHSIKKNGQKLIIYGWLNTKTVYTEAARKLLSHLPLTPYEKDCFMECVSDNFIKGSKPYIMGTVSTYPDFFHANPKKYIAMVKRVMKTRVKNQIQKLADDFLKRKNPEEIVAEVSDNFVININQTSATRNDKVALQQFLKTYTGDKRVKVTAKEIKQYALNNQRILKLFRYTIILHGAICSPHKTAEAYCHERRFIM